MKLPRTVYLIRHNKTNRIYIGSSKNPGERIKAHMRSLKMGKHHVEDMQQDFDTYGGDYTVEYLEVINNRKDSSHEYDWMEHYNSHIRGIGYNYKDMAFQSQKRNPKFAYISEIMSLIRKTDDLSLLDLILQILKKAVKE